MQVTRDMNKCSVKYIEMDQSKNKGIYKINVKKDLQCSFKTMNEVLGIFQREYHPRCYNHYTLFIFSLLGLITSNTSLTNHPKWNKWNILMVRMFSSAHVLHYEQYNSWKVKKQSKSEDLFFQSKMDTYKIWHCTMSGKSPKSMSLENNTIENL